MNNNPIQPLLDQLADHAEGLEAIVCEAFTHGVRLGTENFLRHWISKIEKEGNETGYLISMKNELLTLTNERQGTDS